MTRARYCICCSVLISFIAMLLWAGAPSTGAERTPAQRLIEETRRVVAHADKRNPAPFDDYPVAPVEQALKAAELAAYRKALDTQDCKTAHSLVLEAFLARYPQIADAFQDAGVRDSWWVWVVRPIYPQLAFCIAKMRFRHAQRELDDKKMAPQPFRGGILNVHADRIEIKARNGRLYDIEYLAEHDHVPALIFFLELQSRPDVLRLSPTKRLLYLYRLRRLGGAVVDHERRTQRAELSLRPEQQRAVRCAVEIGELWDPRHFDRCEKMAQKEYN